MNFDPTDIREQERVLDEQSRKDRLSAVTESEDLKLLMNEKWGRRIAWRFLDRAGVFRTSFSTNALSMAHSEGQRNEGLRLLAGVMAHCPDGFTKMMKESKHE